MLPSNISAYVFDTVEGMTQKLSRDPLLEHDPTCAEHKGPLSHPLNPF